MDHNLLSAQEVADILRIARNTVYELIKRGELASSKVGKQVRVSRTEVEAYLHKSKNTESTRSSAVPQNHPSLGSTNPLLSSLTSDEMVKGNELIICGKDVSLDILVDHLNSLSNQIQIFRSYHGSYNALFALYQGRVNVATAHLWDGDTDEYNVTYINKMLPGIPALIIRIGQRKVGFYVPKNNPLHLTSWEDLKRDDISIINREKGSGIRVLLDERLRLMGLSGASIPGYGREIRSHLAVASLVSRGAADLGLGSEKGCQNIPEVLFVPLQTECYDLIIRQTDAEKPQFKAMLEILTSDAFKLDIQSVAGLDTTQTGLIMTK